MAVRLPNGGHRWLRKDRVRQISDGEDLYWLSQSHPIEPAQVQQLPELPVSVPSQPFHQIAGWCTVADVEALIRQERTPAHLRARVFATNMAALTLAAPIGAIAAGFLVEAVGLRTAIVAVAIVNAVAAAVFVRPAARSVQAATSAA